MRRVATQLAVAIGMITSASLCGAVDLDRQIQFEIPAQKLDAALMEFSRQAKIQIVASTPNLSDYQTTGAKGTLTIGEALGRLLGDSGLAIKEVGEETLAIVASKSEVATTTGVADVSSMVRVASLTTQPEDPLPAASTPQDAASVPKKIELEEVVVTGSHIRGARNLSAPVITFDREAIEAGGYSTTQDLMRSLTQNLGDVSEATVGDQNGGAGWLTNHMGSGANLRGLGSSATLVLLNGRRVAGSGDGSYFDISLIPINAIERIDVLTDGASAIYGSDAIGGVVNVVLRRDFTGAETRVRYGSVTEGSHDQKQAGQLVGLGWDAGRAILSYEYHEASPLMGSDRDFVVPSFASRDISLLPDQKRHVAFGTLAHRLTDRIELSADFFYGARESSVDFHSGYIGQYEYVVDAKQYGGAVGLSIDAGRDWEMRFSGASDLGISDFDSVIGGNASRFNNESSVGTIEVAADGPLMAAPGGDVRAAIGGQYRREKFEEFYDGDPSRSHLNRSIGAIYGEVQVPWVGSANRRAGIERLELTLAGRYEDYSDFGTTFNPKVGLSWAPIRDLNIRGTWGSSFRAPLLHQLDPADIRAGVYLGQFLSPSGPPVTGLLLMGNGERLRPEESKNITAGFDFTPSSLGGLTVSGTYFDIEYEERISDPIPLGSSPYEATVDPSYSLLVTRNPAQDVVAGYMGLRDVFCYTAAGEPCGTMPPASSVEVIVDSRQRNFARTEQSGFDLSATYQFKTTAGDWAVSLSGTRLLRGEEQMSLNSAAVSAIDNVWRPVDLRLRGSLSYTRGALNASAFVNYTDGYGDRRSVYLAGGPEQQRSLVGSWTTLDLTLRYDLSASGALGWLKDATLTLSAMNVLDRDPPYVGSASGLNYDGVNASPLGRFLSAQLVARWGR